MKKILFLFLITVTILTFNSCETEQPWQPLFNGENLDNWDKYLGTPLRGFDSLAQLASVENVFSVIEENGEKIIQISGEVNGSLATRESFSDYHLQLVFKWGETVYTTRNSGLLYHSFGDFGAAIGTWMVNIECQLKHENLGDTYLMNNTYCETAVGEEDGRFIFTKDGEVKKFGKEFNGAGIKKAVDAENPLGEWNTVELYSVGGTTVHVVNGQVTMVNNNTGKVENGEVIPLTGGKIQLQSEGGDMFVKSIQVKPIKEIPKEFLK
ncbi:MAG: DUF1080 domain-containing protein [Prolixibacteraceae bacterium]|jgi:hypothetical protein|nr:DUF1080 domain-containing protein [Prolixibacteraceae bacterium]MBT6007318.1 DUF1080 domain-containing protein [Prolixibacteraceae bacterium]MBT6764410.1 DUF1080 domain-containing protein [Prolixibacteraceae bacterium]MBT7000293.1 DUF1080 domain-containing protein [Prolixibacteraceae bacterium]MBT7394032.1 DUF1080 domain-containing protein [Prolixibacteraceae bacterium]